MVLILLQAIMPNFSFIRDIENVDKIIVIVESDHYVATFLIVQELKISPKTVWNHLT